jgi:hypothetical protein
VENQLESLNHLALITLIQFNLSPDSFWARHWRQQKAEKLKAGIEPATNCSWNPAVLKRPVKGGQP